MFESKMNQQVSKVFLYPVPVTAIEGAIQKARDASYDRIIVKFSHSYFEKGSKSDNHQTQESNIDGSKIKQKKFAFDRSIFECRFEWYPDIVLQISHVVDNESSKTNYCEKMKFVQTNEFVRAKRHFGVPIWVPLRKEKSIDLSEELRKHVQDLDLIFIDVPINKQNKENNEITDMWKRWDTFRSNVGFNNKIKLALELTSNLPGDLELKRWFAEPIELITLPTGLFKKSKNIPGCYLTDKFVSICLKFLTEKQVTFVVKGRESYGLEYADYIRCIRDLIESRVCQFRSSNQMLSFDIPRCRSDLANATNSVQSNMQSIWPIYEEALERSIYDCCQRKTGEKISILLCGNQCHELLNFGVFDQFKSTAVYIFHEDQTTRNLINNIITCLDKDKFTIIGSAVEEELYGKMDIVVSVSTEPIHQYVWFRANYERISNYIATDSILIPSQSKLFIAPIMAPTVRNEMQTKCIGIGMEAIHPLSIGNFFECATAQELFTFNYSTMNNLIIVSEDRCKQLYFLIKQDCVVTGFAGYLEIDFYGGIKLRYRETDDSGIEKCSSFMYIPLTKPQSLEGGVVLHAEFNLNVRSDEFWYEWCTYEPVHTHVHNHDGITSVTFD